MKRLLWGALALLGWISAAHGQGAEAYTASGARVPTAVVLCNNAAGQAVFCNTVAGGAGYPAGATPITASASGTTAVTTATLAAVAGKTTYICGFTIGATATTAINGTATIAGVVTGTMSYSQAVAATPAIATFQEDFTPCIPASAANTVITINSIAAGTAGITNVNAQGFQF